MAYEILAIIGGALYWFFPAYAANGAPILFGGGTPMDHGKILKDGSRLFGDGKTWNGFIAGIVIGTIVGYLQGRIDVGLALALGAVTGDLLGSFIKRRLHVKHGKPFPFLDQMGFLLMAILFVYIFATPRLDFIIAILVVTPLAHLGANAAAYKLKLKEVPY